VSDAGVTDVTRHDAGQPSRNKTGTAGSNDHDDAGTSATDKAKGEQPDPTGCGDGHLQPGEACDDGNDKAGDGCSANCMQVDRDYVCPAPGKACVSTVVCGDGRVAGKERCDDGNLRKGDGCDEQCRSEPGFACPKPGALCSAAKCGDHIVAGDEQCDDDDDPPQPGDGCSDQCRIEPGWVCPGAGAACRQTVCNDGKKEGSEACDDGNNTLGDGCTPFCEVEPDCTAGACTSRCGDGLLLPNEACDDGNLADQDGCSAQCQPERGYNCMLEQAALPDTLQVPVTYRDFIAVPNTGEPRHADFEIFVGSDVTSGLVQSVLGMDSKPVYNARCDAAGGPYPVDAPGAGLCPNNQQLTTRGVFDQWYRDILGVNVTKVERMTLNRDANATTYRIANPAFYPWDDDKRSLVGLGRELTFNGHDFGFTSEIHTYFEYDPQHAQTLTFSGDDDVWVFINRHLAVDIGGSHQELERSVTLDVTTAKTLQLEAGKIYEIALFQAERHSPDSHFNLTLEGFASAHSRCAAKCGDGIVAGRETCDDGKNDGSYGSCTGDCQRAAYCGDGKRNMPNEACDDGVNITVYSANGKAGCAPGCTLSAYCGDGRLDSTAGERCDDGKNNGSYGHCGPTCQLGARCGDGEQQTDSGETCDDGNQVGGDGCSKLCRVEVPD
jgi:fibro-slime domain-containing protein